MPCSFISIISNMFVEILFRKQKQKMPTIHFGTLFVGLCLAPSALGQLIVLQSSDQSSPVTPEQIDKWVIEAEKGNWQLMEEFAATYLYPEYCEKLKYGYRCRAMAARSEIGRKFLLKIIDAPIDLNNLSHKNSISLYQKYFALNRRNDARTRRSAQWLNPNDPACKDFIKYMSLAGENGDTCAAHIVSEAYYMGSCTNGDTEKSKYFSKLGAKCPID